MKNLSFCGMVFFLMLASCGGPAVIEKTKTPIVEETQKTFEFNFKPESIFLSESSEKTFRHMMRFKLKNPKITISGYSKSRLTNRRIKKITSKIISSGIKMDRLIVYTYRGTNLKIPDENSNNLISVIMEENYCKNGFQPKESNPKICSKAEDDSERVYDLDIDKINKKLIKKYLRDLEF